MKLTWSKQALSKNICLVEEAAGLVAPALAVRVTELRTRILCGPNSSATSMELPNGAFGTNLWITVYQVPSMSQIPVRQSPTSLSIPGHTVCFHVVRTWHLLFPLPSSPSPAWSANSYPDFKTHPGDHNLWETFKRLFWGAEGLPPWDPHSLGSSCHSLAGVRI